MVMQFPKSEHRFLRCVCHEAQEQELTHELRLSDGMPDIGRVISAWGQVILRSKEWRRDSISFSGGVMAWVLYSPEDGSKLRCIESWVPFQMKWDMEDSLQDGEIRIRPLLRFADARSVSPRKIMLRMGIAAIGEGWLKDSADVYAPEGIGEEIQLLTNTYPVRLQKEAGEKAFTVDEMVEFTGPSPEKLIYYNMEPIIREKKLVGNKLLFRGTGKLHLLYVSGDGMLHSDNYEVPFSQYAQLETEYGDTAEVDVWMGITSLELETEQENQLRVKCGMLAQYLLSDRQMIRVVEDAYSPFQMVTPETDNLKLPAILGKKRMVADAADTVRKDVHSVVDTVFMPGFPSRRMDADRIHWEIPGMFQTLYYDSGNTLQSHSARWDGQLSMETDGQSELYVDLIPGEDTASSVGPDGIETKGQAVLEVKTVSGHGIGMVTALTVAPKEGKSSTRPSLILRRAGEESLWQIAKESGSSVEMIRKANGLEGEPVRERMLLIPVL